MKLSDFKHGTIVKIGQNTYRLYRLEECSSGILGTMTRFASLQPCFLKDGHWWDDWNSKRETRDWSDACEFVDDQHTAVAGEVFDTRK